MKKRKLKFFVMPAVYGILFATIMLSLLVLNKVNTTKVSSNDENYTYVNGSIITKTVPTISEKTNEVVIEKPYTSDKVSIYKRFYEKEGTDQERENAILFYNNTYVQNTGLIYKGEEQFDVISVLNGTVVDVKDDETLGKVVEIKHDNNLITTYQGLSNVTVKKNQTVNQGDIIGKSGKIKINDDLENALLFEIIHNGNLVNPEKYINKKINEL